MSIEKSHFFDQIGAVLTIIMDAFRALREQSSGGKGKHGTFATRQSAAFCGPLKSAGKRFV